MKRRIYEVYKETMNDSMVLKYVIRRSNWERENIHYDEVIDGLWSGEFSWREDYREQPNVTMSFSIFFTYIEREAARQS